MAKLGFLIGTWNLQARFNPDPSDAASPWHPTATTTATFEPLLGGAFLTAHLRVNWPDGQVWQTVSIWSYDRFQETYRVGYFDDLWGLFDVYEGGFEGDSLFIVSNHTTGTLGPAGPNGARFSARTVVRSVTPDRFVVAWEGSSDGKIWAPAGLQWIFTRRATGSE